MTPLKTRSLAPSPANWGHGQAIAEILAGCWRKEPLPAALEAAQLETLLPSLIGSGAGALAWRRLRHCALAGHPAALALQKIHFEQALDAKMHEREILWLLETLRKEGIEPLLVKGWATARLYPEVGMRAAGDIDLLIHPGDKAATERVLGVKVDDQTIYNTNFLWDVKTWVPAIYQLSADTLFAHSERVRLGATELSILGAEEQLKMMCLHFLKHGGWRPLWLCDIAAALEFRPAGFNWERCLGSDRRCRDRVVCTLGLAHQLLGASVAGTPVARRAARLPAWLVPAVLQQWETPQVSQNQADPLIIRSLRRRNGALQAVRKRWPTPMQAIMKCQIPLDWPPLLSQTGAFAFSGLDFLKRTPRLLREEKAVSTPIAPSHSK